jgi:hypothetical protein
MKLIIPDVRELLFSALEKSDYSVLIDSILHLGGRPIIFAGAVRDAMLAVETGNAQFRPRDFDIGIEGLEKKAFQKLFDSLGANANRYGGYHINRDGLPPIDVWRLEETCGIRLLKVPYHQVNVLRSFLINLNAIAFDAHTGFVYDHGCLKTIKSKQVDLVPDALLHSHATFAAKSFLISLRFGLPLTSNLQDFVGTFIEPESFWHEFNKIFGEAENTFTESAFADIRRMHPKLLINRTELPQDRS